MERRAGGVATVRPDAQLRRARVAVAAVFLTNGALFANMIPRYPEIKSSLGLSNAAFGSAVAAFPFGALLAGLFAAAVIGRFGSARVAATGITLLAAATVLVSVAGGWLVLALVLFAAGAIDAVIDVAQNTHGLRVQRRYGRSIVNSFHGVWSIGAVVGGLMGAAAAGLEMPLPAHLAGAAVLFSTVAVVARRFLLGGSDDDRAEAEGHDRPGWSAVRGVAPLILALGVLAACGALVEDAGASWGALYLTDELSAGVATGGLAFVSLQLFMTAGRLTGDRAVNRFGQRTVVRAGGLLTAAGIGVALALPTVATTLAGFACAGLGVATLVPAAMHTADEITGIPPGVGLTIVSWMLRVGFLISPPLVGLVADATSLRVGLLTVVAGGLTTFVLGRVLLQRAGGAAPRGA